MAKVYINGREAVHAGCGGFAIAFPDVCLCPSPSGPVPVPLTNTVQAKDMAGGALTVLIEGYPAGHKDSYFNTSTGNEPSQSTGGGITSHAVRGKAYFHSYSPDVLIEGKPAVRHGDLLTQNHQSLLPSNTPPSVWQSTVDPGQTPVAPKNLIKVLSEGTDWIEFELVNLEGEAIAFEDFTSQTPAGQKIQGTSLLAGTVTFKGLAKGNCRLVFPDIDDNSFFAPNQPDRGKRSKADKLYYAGKPLVLATGKKYRIELPRRPSYWLELTVKHREAKPRGCAYILRSTDGVYEVHRTLADNLSRDDGSIVLQFPDLIADKTYTLTHKLEKDINPRILFQDRPYEKLCAHVKGLQTAEPAQKETIPDDGESDLRLAHISDLHDAVPDGERGESDGEYSRESDSDSPLPGFGDPA